MSMGVSRSKKAEQMSRQLLAGDWQALPGWLKRFRGWLSDNRPHHSDCVSLGLLLASKPFAFTGRYVGAAAGDRHMELGATIESYAGWKMVYTSLHVAGMYERIGCLNSLEHQALKALAGYLPASFEMHTLWTQIEPDGPMWHSCDPRWWDEQDDNEMPFGPALPCVNHVGSDLPLPGDHQAEVDNGQILSRDSRVFPEWLMAMKRGLVNRQNIARRDCFVAGLVLAMMPNALTQKPGRVLLEKDGRHFTTTAGSDAGWAIVRRSLQAVGRLEDFERLLCLSPRALQQIAMAGIGHSELNDLVDALSPEPTAWRNIG